MGQVKKNSKRLENVACVFLRLTCWNTVTVAKNNSDFISELKFQVLTEFNFVKNMIMFNDLLVLQNPYVNDKSGLILFLRCFSAYLHGVYF